MRLLNISGLCILMLLLHRNGCGSTFASDSDSHKAPYIQLFSTEPLAQLNTAGSEFYLNDQEKLIVALCNLARYDGELFIREVLIPSGADSNLPAIKNLIFRLKSSKNTAALMPAFSLHKTARLHAKDMGFSGDSGHVGSDGRNFIQRISTNFPDHAGFAENYHLGSGEAADIVIAMLSENGEGKRYRENILSPNLHYIGVSIMAHRKSCSNTVLDFARKPHTQPGISRSGKSHQKSEAYFLDCPKGRNYDQKKKGNFSFLNLFSKRK